jgi:peptidoglycan/LPS O-acetylase OafA/YrhL
LFIPCTRPDGTVQPVLGLGWTLNYEMFFYFIFIPFLYLREVQAAVLASIVLLLFVIAGRNGLGHGVILQTWSNPIILEFGAGMLLALLPGRFFLHAALRLSLVILALMWLHLQPGVNRVIAYGIPATALVFAAIIGKPAAGIPKLEIWLVRLGDTSYALYLVHPFVMRAASLLWRHLPEPAAYAYVFVTLGVSQLAAMAIHYYFEQPVTRRLRNVAWATPATKAD